LYYSKEVIEEVRARNDIVDLVSEHLALKRRGKTYVGLCPFHSEKTPSFSVSPDRQTYHCFGCGKGGNVIGFVMDYENLSFPEALRSLAARAGMQLPEREASKEELRERSLKERLLEIHKVAATHFYQLLHTEEGLHAYRYLKERGLSDETIRHFGLGFSSKRPGELYHYLKSKGYTDAELRESGLVTIEERGARDKFWNRVMFPIMDSNSRVIAFGGRVMGDGEPKYLNSPETKLFDKSKNLYGLNYARRKREAYIILCEGYMDVIALHQAGFASAVASLGTALTEQQILHIKRTLPNATVAILSYDSDNAGIKAARRAIPMIRSAMLQPRVLSMKPYKDPDEFIKALGREAYEERIQEARNAVLWEVQILATQHDLRDPAEKTRFYEEIAALLAGFSEPLERKNYIDAVAREQMIPADALRQLVNRVGASGMTASSEIGPRPGPGTQRNVRRDRANASQKSQKLLLALLAEEPALYSQLSAWISPSDFTDDFYRELAEKVFEMLQCGKSDIGALLNDYVEDSEKESLVTSVFHTAPGETLSVAEKDQAILDCIRSIRKDAADRKLRNSSTAEELQAAMREKAELQHLKLTIRR
jgi:DNA primase